MHIHTISTNINRELKLTKHYSSSFFVMLALKVLPLFSFFAYNSFVHVKTKALRFE